MATSLIPLVLPLGVSPPLFALRPWPPKKIPVGWGGPTLATPAALLPRPHAGPTPSPGLEGNNSPPPPSGSPPC